MPPKGPKSAEELAKDEELARLRSDKGVASAKEITDINEMLTKSIKDREPLERRLEKQRDEDRRATEDARKAAEEDREADRKAAKNAQSKL